MSRRVMKIFVVFMGVFSIISLIQNNNPRITSNEVSSTSILHKSGEIRVGGDKEGIILLEIVSNRPLTRL